jgi:Mg2+ and Co2+ transporter CorA
LDAKTRNWNADHDITVKGYDVELYIQERKEPHHSTGVYSLTKDKWLKKPVKDIVELNRPHIEEKYKKIVDIVSDIEDKFTEGGDMQTVVDRIKRLKRRLRKMRKNGLETGGEFSTENVVYKLLRRQNIMKTLSDIENQAYDTLMTLEQVVPSDKEYGDKTKVSLGYMKGLFKNVNISAARKLLEKWISRAEKNNSDFIELSPRENEIYKLIKQGGFSPNDFSSKNYPIKKL